VPTHPRHRVTVVLDDDPTGTQGVADVPVALTWDPSVLAAALTGERALHILTNTRALTGEAAGAATLAAARAALAASPAARLLLRGDSTLRAHLWEEHCAVVAARGLDVRTTAALLVPALPAAGRVTRGGVHYLLTPDGPVALSETEYARDGALAYSTSRLLEWAEERSGGRLARTAGRELPLAIVRGPAGADAVAAALTEAAEHGGAVVADAEG
jgi:uncharacterized protein YgbK (DUF1537 family)